MSRVADVITAVFHVVDQKVLGAQRKHIEEVVGRRGYVVLGNIVPLPIGSIVPGSTVTVRSDSGELLSRETNFRIVAQTDWADMCGQWEGIPMEGCDLDPRTPAGYYYYRAICD